MARWFSSTLFATAALAVAGCLPPVQESDTPSVSAETAEESDAGAHQESETAMTDNSDTGAASSDSGDFQSTPSGLKYKIVKPGNDKKPKPTDTVLCHYKGWLDNGKVFDSSYDRGQPIDFPLNGVIAGWTEGLQLIGEGGEIELEIPSELGYGASGAGADIPPNATLHFKVELLEVM